MSHPSPAMTELLQALAGSISEGMAAHGNTEKFSDDDVEGFYSVARTLVSRGQLEDAQVVLSRVCDFRPAEVRYLRALALVSREIGNLQLATDLFMMVDLLEPMNPRNGLDLAECAMRKGDWVLARDLLGFVLAQCQTRGESGRVPDRARALLSLLDRPGATDGTEPAAGA